jgi:hypothetical protein
MIDLWLDTGTAGIVLIPFILLYGIAAAIVWITHLSPARGFFATCVGIAGPFFVSVAVLFSLFAVFLASEVLRQGERAHAAVAQEADGIRTVLRLAETAGEAALPLREAVHAYTDAVLTAEWAAMREGTMAAQPLGPLRALAAAIVAPEVVAAMPMTVHQAMVDAFVEVRHGRMERQAVTARHGASLNWLGMIVLGILTQVAVAVVHLDRLRPQALALFVFTTAFAATVTLIGLHERPFSHLAIDDAPLRIAASTDGP